jgi:PII-like signaling protein
MADSVTGLPPTPDATQPRVLTGERTLMRIIISAEARHEGHATSQAIVELLRARGLAGATAISGIMGFGAHHRIHS